MKQLIVRTIEVFCALLVLSLALVAFFNHAYLVFSCLIVCLTGYDFMASKRFQAELVTVSEK